MIHFGCIYGNRTPFIKLGGFYIGYKKFLVCFKPRGDMNDEFMSLCIEMNNMASRAASGTNRKKYMFSVHAGVSFCRNKQCFIPGAFALALAARKAARSWQFFTL